MRARAPLALSGRGATALLGLLLLGRLLLHALLYGAGFEALTADDFGRTLVAADWALAPRVVWSGFWLPFHSYFYGSALLAWWELLAWPRLLTVLLGLLSLWLCFLLGARLFRSRAAGLLGATLLALNPAHLWLSATPLTEMLAFTLVLAALVGLTRHLDSGRPPPLIGGAAALAMANGVRYEAWMLSLVWSAGLALMTGAAWWRERSSWRGALGLLVGAALPWLFPLLWMAGNAVETGDPLFFLTFTQAYKRWYGDEHDYRFYLDTLRRLDPLATALAPAALAFCLVRWRRSRAVWWYVALTVLPFALFAFLHGGHAEPPGNFVRYLAPFLFLVYPALAALGLWLLQRGARGRTARGVLGGAALVAVAALQVGGAFGFVNDPAAAGLDVGRWIRAHQTGDAGRPVMVELSYWQYLAIHVGANDTRAILYDRPLDFERRDGPSRFVEAPEAARGCLAARNVALVAAHSAEVRAALQGMGLAPSAEVNGYALFPVPEGFGAGEGCPEEAPR